MKQIKIQRKTITEQLTEMIVHNEQGINELQETAKAHAGWIMQLENRIRELEK